MTRRLLLGSLLALAALALMPPGASAVLSAQGNLEVVSGQTNTYDLAVRNTGDETINCMRFTAPNNVTITSVDGANQEAPNRFAAGLAENIVPGETRRYRFRTQSPYPENGGGTLSVSSDCNTDATSQVTGPPATGTQPPPPPPNPPCLCEGLSARLLDPTIRALHGRFLGFRIRWAMRCSAGAPNRCRGRIRVFTNPGDITITRPRSRRVRCVGRRCPGRTRGFSQLRMILSKRLRPLATAPVSRRRRHTDPYPAINIQLRFACIDANGNERRLPPKLFNIQFDRYGQVNRRKSDLNGNGVADGPNRRRPR
ncbi:MAG TPA: hypothetical protein VHG69_14320 [Thermoleophilaceae bacterium]|nr:hypothetical protein [Thermoleophilaceae bacterium]